MASGVPRNRASGSAHRRAKRARTQPEAPPLVGDWAGLPSGPAGLVAERVLAGDVADYARFRAVCTAWRACCPDPRAHGVLDRRFHPRHWIMLPRGAAPDDDDDGDDRRRLLNVRTGERVRVRLPDPRRHVVLGPTAEGLVVLCRKGTLAVRLLNPLTGQLADFPSAATMADGGAAGGFETTASVLDELRLVSAGLAGESTLALHFSFSVLAVAEPGDTRWTQVDNPDGEIVSAMPFAGRFYCSTYDNITVLDTTAGEQPPCLAPAAAGFELDKWLGRQLIQPMEPYLAEIDGELVLIANGTSEDCKAYRVRMDGAAKPAAATPRLELGAAAVFVGVHGGRAVTVPAALCRSISADAVYFCCRERGDHRAKVRACHLVDGRIVNHRRKKSPSSMADYLACYVTEIQDW
ncbi:hypothetical protein ACP4OV_018819 [Aristida adscensionis]